MRYSAGILPDGASRPTIRRNELGSLQYMGPRARIIRFCVAYARIRQLLPSQNADPNIARRTAEPLAFRPGHSFIPESPPALK